MGFGEQLRRRRKELGLSREELADKLELTAARIADLRAAVNFLSPVVEGESAAEEKTEGGEE